MLVARFVEVLPVADAGGSTILCAPERGAAVRRTSARADGHDVLAVEWVRGVGHRASHREDRGHPVHRDDWLIADPTGWNRPGPPDDRRNSNAALPQIKLLKGERPVVRVALTAVVAGEDHQRVAFEPGATQRFQHAPDAGVHALHHGRVNLQRSAIHHRTLAMTCVADGLVFGAFPG